MLPEKNLKALKLLAKHLQDKDINWALVGSTGQALQGVDVKARDIDILTDKKGAYLIGESLKEFVAKPVEYSETEKYRSYHGLFNVEGVEVEVIGELENKAPEGDLWSETTSLSAKTFIEYESMKVPVISLEQEVSANTRLGRPERVKKIKKALEERQVK